MSTDTIAQDATRPQQSETKRGRIQVFLPQATLLTSLSQVLKTTTNRSMPILNHVLLQATEHALTLSATNLGAGTVFTLPAKVECAGVWTIPAKILYECVKTFSAKGTVMLEVSDDHLIVASGRRIFILDHGTNGKDFPVLLATLPSSPVTLNSTDLIRGIKEVGFAADTLDARPVFTTICMHLLGNTANLVAGDGFRMALRTMPIPDASQREQHTSLLVPAPAMRLLSEIMPAEQEVTLFWDNDRVLFACGQVRLISRLVEGTFPNYLQALPRNHETVITLKKSVLTSLLAASKPFTRDSANILRITYAKSGVAFTAKSEDLGEFYEEIKTDVAGEEDQIALNAKYLWQFLKVVAEKEVTLLLDGPNHPCLMKSVGREDYCYTLMPMTLNR